MIYDSPKKAPERCTMFISIYLLCLPYNCLTRVLHIEVHTYVLRGKDFIQVFVCIFRGEKAYLRVYYCTYPFSLNQRTQKFYKINFAEHI